MGKVGSEGSDRGDVSAPCRAAGGLRLAEPLADKTTFGVGGTAHSYWAVHGSASLRAALEHARASRLPVIVLGAGSNVIFNDGELGALVLRLCADDVHVQPANGSEVRVVAAGGGEFDALVAASCRANLWGIECLSGIPGTVGAAPVQNIGAYGQSLADTLLGAWLQPIAGGPPRWWPAAELRLGYRTSVLREAPGHYVVTAIELALHRRPSPPKHEHICRALESQRAAPDDADRPAAGAAEAWTAQAVRQAVLAVRGNKGMLWPGPVGTPGNVGSFFVNPTVSASSAAALAGRFPALPMYPGPAGTKLGAAWLIEAAGLPRGHVFAEHGGRIGLSPAHALSLINRGGARAADVVAAARTVSRRVYAHSGITLRPEACLIGFDGAVRPGGC